MVAANPSYNLLTDTCKTTRSKPCHTVQFVKFISVNLEDQPQESGITISHSIDAEYLRQDACYYCRAINAITGYKKLIFTATKCYSHRVKSLHLFSPLQNHVRYPFPDQFRAPLQIVKQTYQDISLSTIVEVHHPTESFAARKGEEDAGIMASHTVRKFSLSPRRWRARCLCSDRQGVTPVHPELHDRPVGRGPPPNYSSPFFHSPRPLPPSWNISPLGTRRMLDFKNSTTRSRFQQNQTTSLSPAHLSRKTRIPIRTFCVFVRLVGCHGRNLHPAAPETGTYTSVSWSTVFVRVQHTIGWPTMRPIRAASRSFI